MRYERIVSAHKNQETDCDFHSYSDLCKWIDRYFFSNYPIGLLLHHRYHITNESIQLIINIIDYLEKKRGVPVSIEKIYKNCEEKIDEK